MKLPVVGQTPSVSSSSIKIPREWLLDALSRGRCKFEDREISQCRDSITFASDLISHGETNERLRNNLTESALQVIENNSGNRFSPEKIKLSDFDKEYDNEAIDILHLLEAFPVQRADDAVKALYDLYKREDLKKWPSERVDVHRHALFAMATQLEDSTFRPPNLENELKEEIKNPKYAMAAHSALFFVNSKAGIEVIPEVIKVQPDGTDFLAWFIASQLNERKELIPQVASVIKDNQEFSDELINTLKSMEREDIIDSLKTQL